MYAFDYAEAHTIQEATALLSQSDRRTRALAGGTDLIVQMRENRRSVDLIVDIKQIPEVNQLSFDPLQGLTIGAAVSCLRIRNNSDIAAAYRGLIDAVSLIGGIQIQGRATLGGNLVNASPAADSIPALIVHEAVCDIASAAGMQTVPVESFCIAPGKTVLQSEELLVRLRIKPMVKGFGAHYLRFIPRNEMDIAVVGVGASVSLDEDGTHIRSARVALGAVAPTPLFVPEVGQYLAGQPISDPIIDDAARIAAQYARPISDIRGTKAQRKHLAAVLTRRALQTACQRARENL